MKNHLLVLSLLILTMIPQKSFATPPEQTPLLQRLTTPGFTRPEYQTSQDCRIFADHVHILHGAGEARAAEVKKISLDASAVHRLVEAAARGNVKRTPAPTDLPTTRYLGLTPPSASGPSKNVPLRSTGSEILANDAAEAISLINLLDALCK